MSQAFRVCALVSLYPIQRPEIIKRFWCSTQLIIKFIMLIMPTVVGILTIICMINTTPEFESKKSLYFLAFSFMSSWNFMLSRVEHEKSFITVGPAWSAAETTILSSFNLKKYSNIFYFYLLIIPSVQSTPFNHLMRCAKWEVRLVNRTNYNQSAIGLN